jgi:hypothetical protein
MDCLRSFNFTIANQSNYGAAQGFLYWQIGTQHFWTLDTSGIGGSSTYNIQGFKNINIYKIEISGDVNSSPQVAPFQCIVQNWNFNLQIVGQNSQATGNVLAAPNNFGMVLEGINPTFRLSKFQNSVDFESPIQSATQIRVVNFFADGIANNTLLSAQIGYVVNVTVFYKYEGE